MSDILKHKIIDYDFESMGPLDELLDKEAAEGWKLIGIISGTIIIQPLPVQVCEKDKTNELSAGKRIDELIMQKSYPSHPEIN